MPKSIIFEQFGTNDVLKVSLITKPMPKPDEVLIKVHAAALNPIDYKIRNGSSFISQNLVLPSGLGFELSGEIVGLGNAVNNFSVGDEVMGVAGFPAQPGCQAEFVSRVPDALVIKPKSLSHIAATALPIAGLTAIQALDLANIQPGHRVLIHSGSGGVGHLAIQLAKQKGAIVYTTAAQQYHQLLKQLGADYCIDYKTESFIDIINQPVDSVIDLMGGDIGIKSLDILDPSGILIAVPTITADQVVAAANARKLVATGMLLELNNKQLLDLAEQVTGGKLVVKVGQVYALNQVQQAYENLEHGPSVPGKRVFSMLG